MPRRSSRFAFAALSVSISLLAMCVQIRAAQAASGTPVGPLATTRLIAAPAQGAGQWTVGIVVTLAPKAITYWRSPGEAGVPPSFDFSASTNVAETSVAYPAPKRISEADIDVAGYDGEVVFPILVSLRDAKAGATLRLKMDYATCERICLPAHADLSVDLPASGMTADAALLNDAVARVPRVVAVPDVSSIATVTREGTDAWRVVPKAEGTRDLFAEAPEGFFLTTKRDGDGFRVAIVEHPADRPLPDAIRLTMAGPKPVEFSVPVAP